MKRKISLMIILIVLLQIILPIVSVIWESEITLISRAETSGDWQYEVNEDGTTIAITSYIGNDTEVNVPISIDGYSVTSIAPDAFSGNNSLISVILQEGITSIESYAFYECGKLESIIIPKGVEYIGNEAFGRCISLISIEVEEGNEQYFSDERGVLFSVDETNGTRLEQYPVGRKDTEYTIPEGVDSIGNYAFSGCSNLTEITIPSSVESIGSYAFYYCTSLKDITLQEGLSTIGTSAFWGCENLEIVIIPEGVQEIGYMSFWFCSNLKIFKIPSTVETASGIFYECYNLQEIIVEEGNEHYFSDERGTLFSIAETNETKLEQYPVGREGTEYTIPDGVARIDEGAFEGCKSLESVLIPSSVTRIGRKAFSGCSSLTSVGDLSSVTSIEEYTFSGCSSLESVIIPDSVTSIGNYAFSGCSSLESVIIPDSVTSIGNYAFSGCSSLESIVIPNNVTSIAHATFSGCSSLESVIIPDSVTSIGDYAFYGCSSLTSVTIPESVTMINGCAFENCSSLESIEIPSSVMVVGNSAFLGCSSLASIEVEEGNSNYSSTEDGVLFNRAGTKLICYPAGKEEPEYIIPEDVTQIGGGSFGKCTSLENIIIPNSVNRIEGGAFSGCSSLESIQIPEEVTRIEDETFSYCSSLESIEIPSSVTFIGALAFNNCNGLRNVNIPDSVISIEGSAFSSCNSLENIIVEEGNASYSSDEGILFNKAGTEILKYPAGKSEAEYIISEEIYSVGQYAFQDCSNLVSIVVPSSIIILKGQPFSKCSALQNIEVDAANENYMDVDGILFNKAETEIIKYPAGKEETGYIIPSSVTTIRTCAFEDCNSLRSVEIPSSVEEIGVEVFKGCSNLVIYCEVGSEAQTYATNNKIIYMAIEEYEKEEDNSSRYIKNINPETIKEEVLAKIETNGEIKVYKEGTEVENPDTNIGTGMVLKVKLNEQKVEYQAVVIGDSNGNGTTNVSDLTTLMESRAESLGTNRDESKILRGAYEKAVDLNEDGRISVSDITNLCKYIAENK